MSKKKKNKKKKSRLYKMLKPYISDTRVMWSLIGAVGVGVTLAAAFGTERGKTFVDKIAATAQGLLELDSDKGNKNHSTKKQTA
ncbi:hypothetical protein GXP67_35365 [Rhodocytophaga rosea]|uniref:Uncharacterized protein n=1 Tax=Rhodocytophaga rosea TaxID=2704465 RepID=A0A6C0GVJ0_9BACT|nr:hypothetical protein [Rhodocytophaga rosea]QHT71573.1 hypothetical protein GXP67_35365 [Rhodocytophaga rosea]